MGKRNQIQIRQQPARPGLWVRDASIAAKIGEIRRQDQGVHIAFTSLVAVVERIDELMQLSPVIPRDILITRLEQHSPVLASSGQAFKNAILQAPDKFKNPQDYLNYLTVMVSDFQDGIAQVITGQDDGSYLRNSTRDLIGNALFAPMMDDRHLGRGEGWSIARQWAGDKLYNLKLMHGSEKYKELAVNRLPDILDHSDLSEGEKVKVKEILKKSNKVLSNLAKAWEREYRKDLSPKTF